VQLTSPDSNIKTIVSNRYSGCQSNELHAGYALFVNEWNTNNKRVVLMWSSKGGSGGACSSIQSEPDALVLDKWHHVGATLEHLDEGVKATLYVDGVVVASKHEPYPRALAPASNKSMIGAHTDFEHAFRGRIAHVAVWSSAHKPVDAFGEAGDAPALQAHWALADLSDTRDLSGRGRDLSVPKKPLTGDIATPPPFSYLVPLAGEEEMISGLWPPDATDEDTRAKSDALARKRREVVRDAMKHAYGSYERHAFGYDEVLPSSGNRRNNWGGMATTMVDSLDTLWLMGLKDEFFRARDWIRDNLDFSKVQGSVSTFETTIRSLGGLLSAYDLSGDKVFLQRAAELGEHLFKAFGTSSGMPVNQVSFQSQGVGGGGQVVLAEVGTLQLEFRALARHTGNPKYAVASEKVHKMLRRSKPQDGLYGIHVNVNTGLSAGGTVAFGALGDSFFEYLLKIWIQGDRQEGEYLQDYEEAMDGLHKQVLQHSSPNNLAYLVGAHVPSLARRR
jgi:hypothetical protein